MDSHHAFLLFRPTHIGQERTVHRHLHCVHEGSTGTLNCCGIGGKYNEVFANHNAESYLDAYIEAAGIWEEKKGPLFRTIDRKPAQPDCFRTTFVSSAATLTPISRLSKHQHSLFGTGTGSAQNQHRSFDVPSGYLYQRRQICVRIQYSYQKVGECRPRPPRIFQAHRTQPFRSD